MYTEQYRSTLLRLSITCVLVYSYVNSIKGEGIIAPSILRSPPPIVYSTSTSEPLSLYLLVRPPSAILQFCVRIISSQPTKYSRFRLIPVFSINFSNPHVKKNLNKLPLITQLAPLKIKYTKQHYSHNNSVAIRIVLEDWSHLILQTALHFRVSTLHGAVVSSPFVIKRYQLNKFSERGITRIEFVMGNVAQIMCKPPQSDPSPPHIQFLFNNHVIYPGPKNLTSATTSEHYKLINFPPLFDRVALLISSVKTDDAGEYSCRASIPGTNLTYDSIKRTIMTVKVPRENIPVKFRMASHFSYTGNNNIDVSAPVGSTLVLYCIYESAPIHEVTWYNANSDMNYFNDGHFGTLTIKNARLNDSSQISCIMNGAHGKLFQVKIYDLPVLKVEPHSVHLKPEDIETNLTFSCNVHSTVKLQHIVNWFFNGQSIPRNFNGRIIGNESERQLMIHKVNSNNVGIYQCWTDEQTSEKDGVGWYEDSFRVILEPPKTTTTTSTTTTTTASVLTGDRNIVTQSSRPRFPQIIKEIKIVPPRSRRLTLVCTNNKFNRDRYKTQWFVRINNNRLAFYKKSSRHTRNIWTKEIIRKGSILKWTNFTHDMINKTVICMISSRVTGRVLMERRYYLSMKRKPANPTNIYDPLAPFNFLINKPDVSLSSKHLLLIKLSWNLKPKLFINPASPIYKQSISFFQIEYQESIRSHRTRIEMYRNGNIRRFTNPRRKKEWGNITIIDKSFKQFNIMLHGPRLLKPQKWYRFRTLAFPNVTFISMHNRLPSTNPQSVVSNINYRPIQSPWSNSINFEHILNAQPRIINSTIFIPESKATIVWRYSSYGNYRTGNTIDFKILYVAWPYFGQNIRNWYDAIISSRYNIMPPSAKKVLTRQSYVEMLLNSRIKVASLISSPLQNVYKINLSQLNEGDRYLVSIYAIHRPELGAAQTFSSLSRPYLIRLPPDHSNSSDTTFHNKILFLVLGSFAGILFVIAFSMFLMCLWYQIRYHNKKRQTNSAASSIKTSSNHTFVVPSSTIVPATPIVVPASSSFLLPSSYSSSSSSKAYTNHHASSTLYHRHPGSNTGGSGLPPLPPPSTQSTLPSRHVSRKPAPSEHLPPPTSTFSHLYLAQHLSLWSPDHLAQFNHLQHDKIPEESQYFQQPPHDLLSPTIQDKNSNSTATTMSSSHSHKSNMMVAQDQLLQETSQNPNNSVDDSGEEGVRLLDYYQPHNGEQQCTLNNGFTMNGPPTDSINGTSTQGGYYKKTNIPTDEDIGEESNYYNPNPQDFGKPISHYPFSPSALDLYSQKKSKVNKVNSCNNRKDFSNLKTQLKNCKLNNVNNFFPPLRTRLSCFFSNNKNGIPPIPSSSPPLPPPICSDLLDNNHDNNNNHNNNNNNDENHNNNDTNCNTLPKDDTFAEHPFLLLPTQPASDFIQKRCFNHHFNPNAPPTMNNNGQLKSKFLFDPTTDINPDDSISNSTANSAKNFPYSMFPDGVRPCINFDMDRAVGNLNTQTNL